MFDSLAGRAFPGEVGLSTEQIRGWIVELLGVDYGASSDERLGQIAALEALKGAVAAAQASLSVDLYDEQRGADQARGIAPVDTARRVGAQVALARRESPHRGSRHLGLARSLVEEMPYTFGALRRGEISEWRAVIVAQETACTTRDIRAIVDQDIAADLPGVSDRRPRPRCGSDRRTGRRERCRETVPRRRITARKRPART